MRSFSFGRNLGSLFLGLCSFSLFGTTIESPAPEQIGISHTEGKGLGYSKGYSSLDLFLSQPFCQKQLVPFLDLRGHIFNDGKYAANAGLGLRWLNESRKQVWGVNWFYDYLLTSHRPYNQVSMGLEALGKHWGVRLNGYLPVGHKKKPLYEFNYDCLSPTAFLLKGKEQFAMNGIDAEASYEYCTPRHFELYAGAGPFVYWGNSTATENAFRHKHQHAIGGRLRARASFRRYVSLEGITSYDSLFRWTGQVTLALNLPFNFTFGKHRPCGQSPYCLQEKLYLPVVRNEIIVVDRIQRCSTNPDVLDPEFEALEDDPCNPGCFQCCSLD